MSELEHSARRLLAGRPGEGNSARELAERAAGACATLATYLSRLLGETGVHMILQRSIGMASVKFPWLQSARASSDQPAPAALRLALEHQEPDVISDAFVEVFSTFVALLKRLIGDGLVERLLNEVWPAVFVPAVKDPP